MTKYSRIFTNSVMLMTTVSYISATQRDYQQYENYPQIQNQQQHWGGIPAAYSYSSQNLQHPYQMGIQSIAAFTSNQQQQQPSTILKKTWSGAPIVVDYVDDDDGIVQDIDDEQQSVQLAQIPSAAAAQPASTLQSRKPQALNDAFVPYKKHQLSQQPFHFQTKTAHTLRPLYSSGPTELPLVSYTRQARLLPFLAAEAARNFREQQAWVVKSTSLMDRAPSLVGRERLERFAAYAPLFERYVRKYPRRLVPQY